MKALIVDDELNGREILEALLNRYVPEVKEIAMATNAKEGIEQIIAFEPDVVFLDINMPNGNGFTVLEDERVKEMNFDVIFTTAHEEFAVEAFNQSATDYLLKPLEVDRLIQAVSRVTTMDSEVREDKWSALKEKLQLKEKLKIVTREGFELFDVDTLLYCIADGNYTKFYMTDGSKHLVSKTLKTYQDFLERNAFMRIHKSHIVNLNMIRSFRRGKNPYVTLIDGTELEVSNEVKAQLIQLLG